ncbi:hypothetical protein [Sporocytophaga myxococcoides]|uniref:hypothetical protein n=1 Tax=Sporocytophaga myxococcoides TaxID=153721 RepID=UPI0004189F30|nr:hypothetical protein [Sporocytophaga myxococcoides]
MKKEITILTSNELSINKNLTRNYFSKNGFILTRESDEYMIYKRGSLFQNFLTFNSLKWKSEIQIRFDGPTIHSTINVNTIGQIVTWKEEKLWDTFISNFEVNIYTGKDLTENNIQALVDTKSNTFRLIGWALVGAIVIGIPAGIVGYYTNIDSSAGVGATMGAILMMRNKNNKEKQSKVK